MSSPGDSLELERWGMRFVDPAIEAQYGDWHREHAVPFNRAALMAGLVIWSSFLGLLAVVRPANALAWAAVISLVLVPAMIFGILTTYRASLLKWSQPGTSVGNCVAGFVIVAQINFMLGDQPSMN